ncbi:hypothetical protein ACM26V_20550 [Salipaludibacillus sp. HK11]|uniref:hypothetical protein n=1 Tax=Salipaludibacillus sp. HK11 TaxID=3394320 RepID=UPI0039FC60EB
MNNMTISLRHHLSILASVILITLICYFLIPSIEGTIHQIISLLYFEDIKGIRMLIVSFQTWDWFLSIGVTAIQTLVFPLAEMSVADANVTLFPLLGGPLISIVGFMIGVGGWFWLGRIIRRFIDLHFVISMGTDVSRLLILILPWVLVPLVILWVVPFALLGFFYGLTSVSFKKFSLCFISGLIIHYILHGLI